MHEWVVGTDAYEFPETDSRVFLEDVNVSLPFAPCKSLWRHILLQNDIISHMLRTGFGVEEIIVESVVNNKFV